MEAPPDPGPQPRACHDMDELHGDVFHREDGPGVVMRVDSWARSTAWARHGIPKAWFQAVVESVLDMGFAGKQTSKLWMVWRETPLFTWSK